MLYAEVGGKRVKPLSKTDGATCPSCHKPVIAKLGEIKAWHWAHESVCPFEHEPETSWHITWKELFPPEEVEITRENHRADVVHKNTVLEFQRAALSPSEERERRLFWVGQGFRFAWIFDMRDTANICLDAQQGRGKPWFNFRWKYPRRRLAGIPFPFYLDLGFGDKKLFKVMKVHWDSEKVGGWGEVIDVVL